MSHETYELLEGLRRAGTRAAMATLVRTHGTTPRKEGTTMFVGEDGGVFGSVTIGGCVDARVMEHAGEVVAEARPRLLDLQLGDEEAWEIGLTCGGTVDVFLEPVTDSLLELYETARNAWQSGRSVALAAIIAGDGLGSRLLIDANGVVNGVVNGVAPKAVVELLARGVPGLLRSSTGSSTIALEGSEVYIELLRPPVTLVIFGAGAVAIPLVEFAKALGMKTVVVDGRPQFANHERFPNAGELRVGIVSEIAAELAMGPATPVVLTAHDYKIDVPVLKRVLAGEVPYVGLLGSRKRGAAILQMLREEGVAEEQLARVRVPVGLDIGGETSAEIALSIASEIVAVMHGRNGSPLSARAVAAVLPPS
ncbi:MAG TPA: XdhC/CoxI family protein [Thermoanaerobaculia bacterium]|jgi:xanthine dehydrogenase accessory factor|nr:XdhC/CoxI family protein [Thermoanaerobaculia bacterium]